ncbi:MAG TPA: hypothetical protein VIL71_12590 [Spirillospora sp.]
MGESAPEEFVPEEFDHYTTALLFGGPSRVVEVAVLLLHEQRRVRILRGTRRIEAAHREQDDDLGPEDDPVRAAVLAAIPGAGRPLGRVIAEVSASPEVLAVADAMREAGLMRGWRLFPRPTRKGRALRRRLAAEPGPSQAERLAVLGPAGVADISLRDVLRSDDPKPVKLPHGPRSRGRGGSGSLSGASGGDADLDDGHGIGLDTGGDGGGGGSY